MLIFFPYSGPSGQMALYLLRSVFIAHFEIGWIYWIWVVCHFVFCLSFCHAWLCQNVCDALTFLLDNIFIRFGTKLYRQVVRIPMGTNRAPLVADLLLFCYDK